MRTIFSLLAIILSTILVAQNDPCSRKVSGIIRDIDTREVLPFATIKIQNSDKGAISDENGEFIITQICKEEIHLEIRFVGYKTVVHHHDFHHSDPIIYMAPDETLLESIIVEESRSDPLTTISTKRKEIGKLDMINSSMGDLSEELTGVSLLKTGANISKPIIHGLHSNRVLVINDGVRHAYQVWGDEHAPEIDPSHVDQIEIVKGAGTVKYGPDALGGVILYNSKKPAFDQNLNGSVGTSYQTNGKAYSSQLNLGHGSHRFAWNAGAFGIYQGDLKAPDYNLSNTGKREAGLSFNTLLHRPKFDWQVSGSYLTQVLGILRGSIVENLNNLQNAIKDSIPQPTYPFTYDIRNPRQETNHGLLKSNASFFLNDHVLKFQYAIQHNKRKEFDVRRGDFNDRPVIDLSLISHTLESEWIQPNSGKWSGYSGMQIYTQKSTNEPGSNPVNFIPDYNLVNLGAYTVQSIKFNKATLELGARFDFQSLSASDSIRDVFYFENTVNYANTTFTLGFRKELNDYISLFSNIGSAWRPPNVAELYSFGYHQSRRQYGLWRYDFDPEIVTPEDTVYNESLRKVASERSVKWISGIEFNKSKINAELILYANRINNYIFLRPYGITTHISGPFPFFIYDQTNVYFVGSDIDIQYSHSNKLDSEAKISYVHASDRVNNQALPGIPPLNINYSISYSMKNWSYKLLIDYTSKQWNAPPVIEPGRFQNDDLEINRNEYFDFMLPPDQYILLGTAINYEKNRWNASFNIHNLFNTSYRIYTDRLRYFSDAPGRNFSFSLQYTF